MIHMTIGPNTVSTWNDDRIDWKSVPSFTVPMPLSDYAWGFPLSSGTNTTNCEFEPEEDSLYLFDVYVVTLFTHDVTVYHIVAESEERAKLQAWENHLPVKLEGTTLDDHDIIALMIDGLREG